MKDGVKCISEFGNMEVIVDFDKSVFNLMGSSYNFYCVFVI